MERRLQNSILFAAPALIWGSTWFIIKFQLGVVDPIVSVIYRFFLAGIILLLFCKIKRLTLKFTIKSHLLFLIQGLTLFGLNYWLVYLAEQYLTSGLIAVIFSLVVFTNMFFGFLILKARITWNIFIGGVLAITGTALIFKKEFLGISTENEMGKALIFGLISLLLASLGNVISAHIQSKKIPVVQANTFGMLYGAAALFVIGLFRKVPVNFDIRLSYVLSLFYLAIFGSVVAFTVYLRLIGKVGPSKGAYAVVFAPVIAMLLSTFFESYEWQKSAIFGMPVLILGNLIALRKIKKEKRFIKWKFLNIRKKKAGAAC